MKNKGRALFLGHESIAKIPWQEFLPGPLSFPFGTQREE